MAEVWELVEDYGPSEGSQVVGRYTDKQRALQVASMARLSSHPVEPGDEWGPDYYVRLAADG